MNKKGTVIRYDIYKRSTTPRLPPIFIQSIAFSEEGNHELFRVATKAFHFDRSEILKFINNTSLEKPLLVSKSGSRIVKVFSDSSPAQRIAAEKARVEGIYGKVLTEEQTKAKEYYQSVLDKLLSLTSNIINK